MVSFDIEPFTKYGQHATDTAYPHADSLLPVRLYILSLVLPHEMLIWYE